MSTPVDQRTHKKSVNRTADEKRSYIKARNIERSTARREAAEKRQAKRDARSPEQQIELIIERGGKPDCREILRLQKVAA